MEQLQMLPDGSRHIAPETMPAGEFAAVIAAEFGWGGA